MYYQLIFFCTCTVIFPEQGVGIEDPREVYKHNCGKQIMIMSEHVFCQLRYVEELTVGTICNRLHLILRLLEVSQRLLPITQCFPYVPLKLNNMSVLANQYES